MIGKRLEYLLLLLIKKKLYTKKRYKNNHIIRLMEKLI